MPRLSVIIPTYKRPEYLKKAVTSVLNQTFKDWEIVVIGRSSGLADQNAAIVESFRKQGVPITYTEHDKPGVSAARNIGIEKVTGEYVAFLDDDDEWLPEKSADHVAYLDAHPDTGLVYSTMEIYRQIGGRMERTSLLPKRLITTFDEMFDSDFWVSPTMMTVRRECLRSMDKWFDPRYLIGEDWEFSLRFVRRWKMAAIDKPGAMTVKDGHDSLTQNQVKSAQQGILILQNLKLEGEYARYAGLVRRHEAKLHYSLGQRLLKEKRYREAMPSFKKALSINFFVGLTIPRKSDSIFAKIWQLVKSFLAVPGCYLLGMFHVER